MFWKNAANLQENTHAEVWFQLSCEAVVFSRVFVLYQILTKSFLPYHETTQSSRDIPWTSPEGPLRVQGTCRRPSGTLRGTNKEIDDLVKKVFFRYNSSCFAHPLMFFTGKINMQKFHGTSTGPSWRTSRGPNEGTFWGCPWDVGHTCFLNSTQKHI